MQTVRMYTPRRCSLHMATEVAKDHYKALRPRMLAKYQSNDDADRVVPNAPKAAERYGITIPINAAATGFHAAFKADAFTHSHAEMGETIALCGDARAAGSRQAVQPHYSAMDTRAPGRHLKLSYPRGPMRTMVVSVGLSDGHSEDVVKVIFSDSLEKCHLVKMDFGPLLEARPQVFQAVANATCRAMQFCWATGNWLRPASCGSGLRRRMRPSTPSSTRASRSTLSSTSTNSPGAACLRRSGGQLLYSRICRCYCSLHPVARQALTIAEGLLGALTQQSPSDHEGSLSPRGPKRTGALCRQGLRG